VVRAVVLSAPLRRLRTRFCYEPLGASKWSGLLCG
jgi:hypothetical protein